MSSCNDWTRVHNEYTSDYDPEAIDLQRTSDADAARRANGGVEFLPSFQITCKDCGGTEFAIHDYGCGGESGGNQDIDLVCCGCGNTDTIHEVDW